MRLAAHELLEALGQALQALNTTLRFRLPALDMDSYHLPPFGARDRQGKRGCSMSAPLRRFVATALAAYRRRAPAASRCCSMTDAPLQPTGTGRACYSNIG